jgi:hypothetical protein
VPGVAFASHITGDGELLQIALSVAIRCTVVRAAPQGRTLP